MKIIVPMAGRGSRLRPHTLTVPKPLIPVAGMPIVHRLVQDIAKILNAPIQEIAFVLGDPAYFGDAVTESLTRLASGLGAKATIYRQGQALGTGHAIMCAAPSLSGPTVIAYADTLIRAQFKIDAQADGVIWTKKVSNPEAYGVVKLKSDGNIEALIEKPTTFESDQVVIGIYYFKEGAQLKEKLQEVIDEKVMNGGEYQINDGIERLIEEGLQFKTATVEEWMDCGNKTVTLETNAKMLGFLNKEGEKLIAPKVALHNSKIIEPCYIANQVSIHNSIVGPNVSIGENCTIENTIIKNSLVQTHTVIKNANLDQAMIGNHVTYNGKYKALSLGDYTSLE